MDSCGRAELRAILGIMRVLVKPVLFGAGFLAAGLCVASLASGDEIKLKDGKKLYGVIVGYEDNMFRVKTDFGFVLVEKDKIASIVPTGPAGNETATTPAKASKPADAKEKGSAQAESASNAPQVVAPKQKITDALVKPSLPVST